MTPTCLQIDSKINQKKVKNEEFENIFFCGIVKGIKRLCVFGLFEMPRLWTLRDASIFSSKVFVILFRISNECRENDFVFLFTPTEQYCFTLCTITEVEVRAELSI